MFVTWVLIGFLSVKLKLNLLEKGFQKMKKAQIWVETVIYTLIGLAIIGLLLSIVKPAIEKKQDQILIESSLEMLGNIKSAIEDVKYYGTGNSRNLDLRIKKGKLEINGGENKIVFSMKSRYKYSEVGQVVESGKINILTSEKGDAYDVSLTLNYKGSLDLTWQDKNILQSFQSAPTPYRVSVTNMGKKEGAEFIQIDFS